MTNSKTLRVAMASAVLLAFGACMDLEVENPNEPTRERALSSADDVNALLQSQFRLYWSLAQGGLGFEGSPHQAFDNGAEIFASTSTNDGTFQMGVIPAGPVRNELGYNWSQFMRVPWLDLNRALASIRDAVIAVENQDLGLQQPARFQSYAKFMQGIFHGYLALMYDRAFILDETVEDPGETQLQPYDAVMQTALGYLDEARTIAANNDFNLPEPWLGTGSYSSQEFVRIIHSYQARYMTAVARSPQERANVDWGAVLTHTNQGITEDFGVQLDGFGGVWNSPAKQRSSINASVMLTLLGPADQSGAYHAWEQASRTDKDPFNVDTDDRRITGAGGPTTEGKYVQWRDFTTNIGDRGREFLSKYSAKWWRNISDTGTGFAPEMTVEEMEFLAAEAHIRQGNPGQAVPLINDDRTSEGELAPADENGVSGSRCVPRAHGPLAKASDDVSHGECGDLMMTLIYEHRIETWGLSAGLPYFHARGWGVLRDGRPCHMPIPMEDIQNLPEVEGYTFGGGGEGSVPNC